MAEGEGGRMLKAVPVFMCQPCAWPGLRAGLGGQVGGACGARLVACMHVQDTSIDN